MTISCASGECNGRLHHQVVVVVLVVSLVSAVFVGAAPAPRPPGGVYTTRYDHIDVENILNQKRLVYYYAECMLDRGPCPPQGLEFKRILPEALKTNCLYCTEKQRFVTYRSIRRLRKEYPDVWAQLAANWDPTGEYFLQLEQSVINDKSTNIFTGMYTTTTSRSIQKIPPSPKKTPAIPLVIRTTTRRPTTTTTQTTTTRRPTATTTPTTTTERYVNINEILPVNNNLNSINTVEGQSSEDAGIFLSDRFGSSSSEIIPSPETPVIKGTSSSTIRSITNSPSFNNLPVGVQTLPTLNPLSSTTGSIYFDPPVIITSKPPGNILPTVTTVKRINISFDGRPFSRPPGTIPTPINNLIRGTNQIVGSITDIASRVLVTGNNLAGMVFNTVQNVLLG